MLPGRRRNRRGAVFRPVRLGVEAEPDPLAHLVHLVVELVLVEEFRDRLAIEHDLLFLRGHLARVIAEKERRGHDAPEREMSFLLLLGEAVPSCHHHVGIIPISLSCPGGEPVVFVGDRHHALVTEPLVGLAIVE
jgi:hypothetical protein